MHRSVILAERFTFFVWLTNLSFCLFSQWLYWRIGSWLYIHHLAQKNYVFWLLHSYLSKPPHSVKQRFTSQNSDVLIVCNKYNNVVSVYNWPQWIISWQIFFERKRIGCFVVKFIIVTFLGICVQLFIDNCCLFILKNWLVFIDQVNVKH